MASTRNNNTNGNYRLEQRNYHLANTYIGYEHSAYGQPAYEAIPCFGVTPSKMSRDTLSHNSIDIESYLRGIGSTNLVQPLEPVVPKFKSVQEVSYYERLPLFVPQPLVIENNQRPLFQ
jgi:hypothetical protein